MIGQPDLAQDPRFRNNGDRVTHRAELTQALEATLTDMDGEALCQQLLESGVPAGPVLDTAQVMASSLTAHRQMAAELDDYRCTGIPIKLSRTPGAVRSTPPQFNQHGHDILAEYGYSDSEIKQLAAQGILVEQRRR